MGKQYITEGHYKETACFQPSKHETGTACTSLARDRETQLAVAKQHYFNYSMSSGEIGAQHVVSFHCHAVLVARLGWSTESLWFQGLGMIFEQEELVSTAEHELFEATYSGFLS